MKFLKLTNVIINTSHINKIIMKDNKYFIEFNRLHIDGSFLLGSGGISSVTDDLLICKKNDYNDYLTLSLWIDKLTLENL